jgi:hypothetical protein
MSRDLSPLGLKRIQTGAKTKLAGAYCLGVCADSAADVVAFQLERSSVVPNAAQRNVNMGVLGVEVPYSSPFQFRPEVLLHPSHQLAGQIVQVHAVAKLRRHDELPEPRVAGLLPAFENLRRLAIGSRIEARAAVVAGSTLPSNIPAVRPPLACGGVARVHDADRTTLIA